MKTRRLFTIIALSLLLVGAKSPSQSDSRFFPPNLTDWTITEWQMMYPVEQWFFLHGFYLGSYAPLTALEDNLIHDPDGTKLYEMIQQFRDLYEMDVNDLHTLLTHEYGNHPSTTPLWLLPYRAATQQKELNNG